MLLGVAPPHLVATRHCSGTTRTDRLPGGGGGTDALRPRHATADAHAQGVGPVLSPGRATAEARQGVPLRQAGYLGEPDAATTQVTDRYGTARAMAWDRIHLRLTARSAWIDHTGELPIIEGTLIRLQVDRLPCGGDSLPLWLWSSATGLDSEDVDVRWQAFLRRFDIDHLFRLMKQPRGWTRPELRRSRPGT
jgi:hypothetical protein